VVVDLKESLDHLSELIGEIYSEDLLDVIFSEFCIGK
jgi:tRNA modification GTPase